MQKIILWLKVARPQTLFASICPVLIGFLTIDSIHNPLIAIITLICALSLQLLSNFVNDYYDYKKGADKSGRIGPSRALAEGLVTMKQMKKACFVMLGISLTLGAVLIINGGWLIAIIGILAIIFAWLYTATRFSLAYLGIADIVCILFYGPIASIGTAYLQIQDISQTTILAGCICGCLSECVLFTNNIRDIESDKLVAKRTFAVRIGKKASLVVVGIILLSSQILMCLTFGIKITLVISIIEILVYAKLLRSKGKEYNKCLLLFGITNVWYVICVIMKYILHNL